MSELPDNWVETTIGDVYTFVGGGTPSKAISSYWNGNIPWASIKDISQIKILENTQDHISEEGLRNSAANIAERGDLILGTRMLPGKTVITKIRTAINQDLKIVKPKTEIASKFTMYQFDLLKDEFIARSGGTTVQGITINKINEIPFLLPPVQEQKRIVAKLDSLFGHLDQLKDRLENIPVLLKQFRQAVLTQAVTGKLTEGWRNGDEKTWEDTTIGKLFSVETGATPKRGESKYYDNANIPWVKSGLVKNEVIYDADEFITEIAVKETNAKIFPTDTLLVAMYGEGKTRGQVGWLKIEAATNQAIAALVNEKMPIATKSYVYYFCLSQYNEIRAQAEGGNQPNLNLSKIKNWEISLPDIKEQKEIVRRVESLFATADKIEASYKNLREKIDHLPQAILAKAFRGELVVQKVEDELKKYNLQAEKLSLAAEP